MTNEELNQMNSDIKERMLTPLVAGLPWCFPTLTKLTYGRRKGEIYGLGAGVGVGKTGVFTQQISYDIDVLNEKVGVVQDIAEYMCRLPEEVTMAIEDKPNET